jgi:class 3 adenylate cyclase
MLEAVTKSAKYIFLDIVGFTHNRSVEAQTELISVLNLVVLEAVSRHNIEAEDRILLPTGDGICLVLLSIEDPYDIHVQIALSLIEGIEKHNTTAKDEQRKFKIRVGINSNVDNLVTDVNGNRNIAGAGINLAQRVMSAADGNQILVGQPVFDTLSQREQYMHAFRSYVAEAKHGFRLPTYQLVIGGFPGLDVTTPSQFREEDPKPERIPEIAAYYMAHAMVHRAEIAGCTDRPRGACSLVVLIWMLAEDSYIDKQRAPHEPPKTGVLKHVSKYESGFLEQFNFYESQNYWLCTGFANFVMEYELGCALQCFEGWGVSNFGIHFVSPTGQKKLKTDWPEIWEELNLEAHSNLVS